MRPHSESPALRSSWGTLKLKNRSSCLGHQLQHLLSDAVLHRPSLKEVFHISDHGFGDLPADMPSAACDMRSDNCSGQFAQWVSQWQRFQRVGYIEGATEALPSDFR